MRAPAKIAIMNVVTVLALSIMAFVIVLLLAQNRALNRDIKAQTDINQRYLRCILLIPQDEFKDTPTRVKAIDKCSLESKLPDGQPVGEAPTGKEREQEAERQKAQSEAAQPQTAPQQSPPSSQPSQAPIQQSATPTQPEPAPEPGLIEQTLESITKVLPI